jgi:hypothetical protein
MLSFLCHLPRVFHGASRSNAKAAPGPSFATQDLRDDCTAADGRVASRGQQKTVQATQRIGIAG